ncbi:MAG: adenylate/guanylate cyclase domain-containing protein [Aureibaculum sp.]
MKTQLTIILIAFSFGISAQIKLDSLYAVWQDQSQEDSTRVGAYKDYIWHGFLFSKPDSAFILAERLYEFANQQNYLSANAQGLYIQGISLHQRGIYSEALVYYKNGSDQFEEIGDQEGIASCLNATGLIYLYKNHYSKALNYFTRSLKIRNEINDRQGVASVLNNIGYIYHNQRDYPNALDYYSQSLEIREDIGDQQGIATSLINIGEVYTAQDDYLKSLDYYSRSLKLFEEIDNQQGVASALNNFGYAYRNQGDYPNALNYYLQSLKIREDMGDQHGITTSLNNIGNIYKIMGNYPKAIAYCKNGLELANRVGLLLEQKEGCKCLYDVYKAIGNGNKALEYHELLTVIEDSLNAEGTSKKLLEMEFQKQITVDSLAQVEKDRLVQKANDDEVRKKNKTINIAIGGVLIFMILAGGFFSRWRYIKKSRDIISKEKDRSENLLLNILPPEIAEELKTKGRSDARDFDKVSILFTDFKSFTEASAKLSAQDLVSEINACFEVFDGIMDQYGIEKIKTIGDAYMAAGGLPVPSDGSTKNTVLAALDMQTFISRRKVEMETLGKHSFEMRAGIHTGPVVAGIVGVKKFQYDIWGDTVNTASRMESNGQIGKVNISKHTYELIKDDPQFIFESRGKIKAKGKGEIEMYFVERADM